MVGKITRIIIGIILLAVAIWLFRADMSWTGIVALIFSILALLGAFVPQKKGADQEQKIEDRLEKPKNTID